MHVTDSYDGLPSISGPTVDQRVGAIEDAIIASRRAHAQSERDTMFYAAGLIAGTLATFLIMRYVR